MDLITNYDVEQLDIMAKFFRGFGDKTRLMILKALHNSSMNVNQLVELLQLPQSTVSSHLRCLRDCNLVVFQKVSREKIYMIASPKIDELLDLAEIILKSVYKNIWACVNYTEESS